MATQVRGAIVVLTGAGVSAESGLPTFRGGGGLWEGHRVEDVATPGAFARDPGLVQRFYNAAPGEAARPGDHAQRGPSGAGRARAPLAGRVSAGHPERRRPARARRQPAAWSICTASCMRAPVPGLRGSSPWDGGSRRHSRLPGLRRRRAAAPRYRLVRRDALPHGRGLRGARAVRDLRGDRHLGVGLSGRGLCRGGPRRRCGGRSRSISSLGGPARHFGERRLRAGVRTLVPALVRELLQ